MESYMTVRDVAVLLKVSISKIRQLTNDKELDCARIGRLPRYTMEDIQKYVLRARGEQS